MGTSVVVGKSTWATPGIAAELLYLPEESELRLRVMAKENLWLTHVGGDKSIFQKFGAGKPIGFTATYIGDGVETPSEMLESIALMNQMERHHR